MIVRADRQNLNTLTNLHHRKKDDEHYVPLEVSVAKNQTESDQVSRSHCQFTGNTGDRRTSFKSLKTLQRYNHKNEKCGKLYRANDLFPQGMN